MIFRRISLWLGDRQRLYRASKILLLIVLSGAFLAPQGEVFVPDQIKSENWENAYVWDSIETFIPYTVLVILTISYTIMIFPAVQRIIGWILIGVSFLLSFGAFFSLGMPMQDFLPGLGMIFDVLIFPSVVVMIFLRKYANETRVDLNGAILVDP